MDHPDTDAVDLYNTRDVGQTLTRLARVFVPTYRQRRRYLLQTVQNPDAFQVAAVQQQVAAGQRVQNRRGQVPSAAGRVRIRNEADLHDGRSVLRSQRLQRPQHGFAVGAVGKCHQRHIHPVVPKPGHFLAAFVRRADYGDVVHHFGR